MTPLLDRLRNFADPLPAAVREHPVRNGALLVAILALVTFSAVTHNIPLIRGVPGRPVRAEFASTNQVNARTPVRVHGVEVGRVQKVDAGSDPRRSSIVVMRITDDDVTVHRDARADIRWRTLLGGSMYIDLDPGSPSAPPLRDGVIPLSRTSSQAELDDVLQPYDGGTAQAQRDTFKGLAAGFDDPRGIDRSIDRLRVLRTVARGMQPLRGRDTDDVRRLVTSTAKTASALGRDTSQLQALVDGADRTLGAIANRRNELGELIELSPSTLDQTSMTMTRLRTTLDHLDPLVGALRPGAVALAPAAKAAAPALRQTRALLAQARPLLRDASPTFAGLKRAGAAGAPLLRNLDPAIKHVADDVVPFLRARDDQTKLRTYEAIGPFFSSLAMAGAEYDGEGHRLRLAVPGGSNSVVTLAKTDMTTDCRRAAAPSQRGLCGALAKMLAQTWFGRGRR